MLVLTDIDAPPAPAPDEVKVRIRAVALNHIDVWSWRGMAFAKRKLPIVLGAEAAGEVIAVGSAVEGSGDRGHRGPLRGEDMRDVSALPRGPRQFLRGPSRTCTAFISTASCASA